MVTLTNVEKRLRQIREKNKTEELRRLGEIEEKFPFWKDLTREESKIGFDLARYTLEGKSIDPLRARSEEIQAQKAKALRDAGYPEDYLDPIYNCPICKDTGADGTKMCICKRRMVNEELYQMSGIEEIIKYQNFDNFDLDLFRPVKEGGEALSPRQVMENLHLPMAKEYAKNFPNNKDKNLYFYGPVGTGKTYMTNCIAKEVMDRGYSVVYQSATSLLNFIGDYNFAPQEVKEEMKPKYGFLKDADLLIIDDLGTEFSTVVSTSNFFELINERLLDGKAIIISTNLDHMDLREDYDDRIYSRILGNFKLVNFFGDDLRRSKYT